MGSITDVLQELALTLWQKFPEYDPGRPFGAWARGIAANLVLRRRRDDARFPVAFPPETIQAVLDAFDRTEPVADARHAVLRFCVRQLPERSRKLLQMRYEDGLKSEDIARRTGRSPEAVRQALFRIRGHLETCVTRKLNEIDGSETAPSSRENVAEGDGHASKKRTRNRRNGHTAYAPPS